MLSPDGKVMRYIYGIQQHPQTMKLGLLEASEGKLGTTIDKFVLNCFSYNPDANKYTFTAFWIMRAGGILTLIILGGFIGKNLWQV